jgi:prepilin-type N-terminal cleavage/methylation domain-containing protein
MNALSRAADFQKRESCWPRMKHGWNTDGHSNAKSLSVFHPCFIRGSGTLPVRGFTLVELLVVIAIIGVLVALLLPAVQAAREAARRCQCVNNVSQIGLAVHSYEFHFEHLPAGVTNATGPIRNEPEGTHISWIVKILPFMEETTLYRSIDQAAGAYAGVNAKLRALEISTIKCPSNPEAPTNEAKTIAYSNYVGCHHDIEAPINEDNNGLLFLNSKVRFNEIYDGSTKTILIGEKVHSEDDLGWMSGTRGTLRNTGTPIGQNPNFVRPGSAPVEKPRVGPMYVGGFGTYHSGGVAIFGIADGSARGLTSDIDPKLFQLLGNRADGEITALPEW